MSDKNPSDEIDTLLSKMPEAYYFDEEEYQWLLRPEARQQLLSLLDRVRVEARIDELELTMDKWNDLSVSKFLRYASDRIKQLRGEP